MRVECELLFREDLKDIFKFNKIENIHYTDFKGKTFPGMIYEHLMVFIDSNGDTKILKNRYGKEGIIK